ncbi:MAG: methylated-DNA--[protein]-cysteine S-methyltransferase [Prevotellaceae bacterium]|jgi:methylated-DNA-[protein]-cysteine S-methyltransferase|nr:methylated-DNA--[protein]-cysteine S-methyltransferase [Prevotellaceae bacterium]
MELTSEHIIKVCHYAAPCGPLVLGELDGRLCLCDWDNEARQQTTRRLLQKTWRPTYRVGETELPARAAAQLDEYFDGRRTTFDLPLLFAGTAFQQRVWTALLQVPYGTTVSYGELAARLGRPTAVRAVAGAVGANPLSIFVPCHRIVGSDGSLTGYAGGLAAKQFLLEHEQGTYASVNSSPRFG